MNTTSDPFTQLATTYSPDEIAFVKRLLDAMFETNNTRISEAMVVSGMQAMQLARVSSADAGVRRRESMGTGTQGGAAQSLTMSQAETVMQQLVDEGWMEKSRKGFYGLSPRGLMELRGWLIATYNDEMDDGGRAKVKFCAACRDIITVVSCVYTPLVRDKRANVVYGRANDAPTVTAAVDCTITVSGISFACSRRRNVPFARLLGPGISLSGRERLLRRIDLYRARDGPRIRSDGAVLGIIRRLLLGLVMRRVVRRKLGELRYLLGETIR